MYDPDGHIIEIGEHMETVVWRLFQQGLSSDQIREKTAMSREFIELAIQEQEKSGPVQ